MKVGFSLSPGGLLLPYHLGALDALAYKGRISDETPIAGASAGAIGAASFACGLDLRKVLEATIDISDECHRRGGARGRLLPLLRRKLDEFIGPKEFEQLEDRKGDLAIAYRELFPRNRPIHQTKFEDRGDLMDAVCHSSMFPYFSANAPATVDYDNKRVLVDGFFCVPPYRFGCPDFAMAGIDVDKTVTISVFPMELAGMLAPQPCICPSMQGAGQLLYLARMAALPSSAKELTKLFEAGWEDAERWMHLN